MAGCSQTSRPTERKTMGQYLTPCFVTKHWNPVQGLGSFQLRVSQCQLFS